ncbi:MAG: SLC13 family permease [Opitutales bacterium]
MDTQIILTIIFCIIVFLYMTQLLALEITSILILPVLALCCPYMTTADIFSGISSPATITIICMFILSAGMLKSGALEPLSNYLSKQAKKGYINFLLHLAVFVPIISALINNTPLVVMLVPVVLAVARENSIMPSKLLIPLSYFSILGGTFTLIGTNTNILVNQLYIDMTGKSGFSMFEFSPMGSVYMIIGLVFIMTIGLKLLPSRTSLSAILGKSSTAKYVTELSITKKSPLCGKSIEEAFTKDSKIRVLQVIRNEEIYALSKLKEIELQADDDLIIEASVDNITKYLGSHLDLPENAKTDNKLKLQSMKVMIDEAVVLPDSKFVGATLESLKFSRNFGAVVLGIQRGGRHHKRFIASMEVRAGDLLLLQSDQDGFDRLRDTGDVLLLDKPVASNKSKKNAYLSLLIMALVIGGATFTSIPLVILAIIGCAAMFLLKIIDMNEGFGAIDSKVILLLVGAIPLGAAMQKSGLAQLIADTLLGLTNGMPNWVVLSMFYLLTSLLAEIVSNKATAVMLTPIAIQFAATLGVDPKPFLMAICFGASASFMTPIGYATNTIVMGPGGYKYVDYLKIGIPLNILMWIIATILIPIFYPF